METEDLSSHVLNPNSGSRRILSLVANRWTVLVMYLLAVSGTMRFNQLQQTLNVSQKVLTHTLRNLEHHGLVERRVYPVIPPKVEYTLTKLGLTLQEPLTHLCHWGETHIAELETALASQQDRTSGNATNHTNSLPEATES
jgi:DNA-binding HxlR family transcriptional regulator